MAGDPFIATGLPMLLMLLKLPILSFGARGGGPVGVGSSFMHAVSNTFVHFPLAPAWLCFKCCRKWSALKNFFCWLHSPYLCTWFRWSLLCSQLGGLGNCSPQYPQTSAVEDMWPAEDGLLLGWNAARTPVNAAQDHEWRRRCSEFWCRSASFLFLKRFGQN